MILQQRSAMRRPQMYRKCIITNGIFQKFTERAIKATIYAQKEAVKMSANRVTTEHMLIALADTTKTRLSPDRTRAMLYSSNGITSINASPLTTDAVPFAGELRRILERSVRHRPFVNPEHIFICILDDSNTLGYKLLQRLDVDINELRSQLTTTLTAGQNNVSTIKKDIKQSTKEPAWKSFCKDLCEEATQGNIDPAFGRDPEILRAIQILIRRRKNNPILLGHAGVGKTAIVEGLALAIAQREVPDYLLDKRIIQLDIASLVAGTKERGELEQRLTDMLKEFEKDGNIIMMIDEVHTLVASTSKDSSRNINLANVLKPALAKGLQCIGATTLDEYSKHFARDPALARRFQPVFVDEPSAVQTLTILRAIKPAYEAFHKCIYTEGALQSIVNLADRYIRDRTFPDKAVDILDEAGSRVSMGFCDDVRRASTTDFFIVDTPQIEQVVSAWKSIPLQTSDSKQLDELEEALRSRLVGQNHAIERVVHALRRSKCGLKDARRPMATMLFSGPPGVGKTHLATSVSDLYDMPIIRMDMSEYSDANSLAKLVGAPPGYLGFEEGGELTNAVKATPFSIVLFDNVEKAHPKVFNIVLQIAEDGRLTDSRGKVVSFSSTLVVLATNVRKIEGLFSPELINRFDDIIHFNSLQREHIHQIVCNMVVEVQDRIKRSWDVEVDIPSDTLDFIVTKASEDEGARLLRSVITHYIENPVVDALLARRVAEGGTMVIDVPLVSVA